MERRSFLKHVGALGAAAGLPTGAQAAGKAYDPAGKYDLKVAEVPYLKNAAHRQLMARVYQPQGAGPFPMVLDLHGGAWTRKDRSAEEPMDRAIAASGVVVVAIDMTLSGEAPYPGNIRDAHYGVRWLKSKAAEWKGDATSVGIYGSSTGGHIGILLAMRPGDTRYGSVPLEGAPNVDASVAYVASRSPISDPYARWQQAEKMKREELIKASKASVQKGFADTYRAAGGNCQYELFEKSEHEWTGKPGPMTNRAYEMVKAFIARNVNSPQAARIRK
jgi:acetyl esterase